MEKKMSIIEHLMKNRHRNTLMSSENGEKCKMSINFDLTKEEYDDISKHFDNKDYLLNEYKEPIKLTHDEYIILKNIDEQYQWIARDIKGTLYIYDSKPQKLNEIWWFNDYIHIFDIYKHLFQFIKFKDEEPYNIQELLDNCEVVEDE